MDRFVRAHLAAALVVTCITAIGSIAYFHIDEHYQVLEPTFFKLGLTEAWTLPFEYPARMRPWLQPGMYVAIGRGLGLVGVTDPFHLAAAFRLVTGLLSWASLVLFVRTTLPWIADHEAKILHVRVATMLGFLPYLFVRTSSETLAMATFTAAFAIALEGATRASETRWNVPASAPRMLGVGVLLGAAFEARFQSAFLSLGLIAWLVRIGRVSASRLAAIAAGGLATIGAGAVIDHWGYGEWVFPALTYLRTNLVDGVAALFGAEPPFAYAWMLPANVFFPIVAVLLVFAVVAWIRNPRHPLTWTCVPFFLVHNLLSHKEERFLFPMAILATALVPMAIAPSSGRPLRFSAWAWRRRRGVAARLLAAWSVAMMTLLAVWPLGWHHHVRFTRYVRRTIGDELHAHALPELDLGLPAYHGRVYDVAKSPPEEIARRLDEGTAREWLVADTPVLRTGVPSLDARTHLVWTELPGAGTPVGDAVLALVQAYDARARPPLRPITFRSLYRLDRDR
jgi:phosphatidylinositol glycan class B